MDSHPNAINNASLKPWGSHRARRFCSLAATNPRIRKHVGSRHVQDLFLLTKARNFQSLCSDPGDLESIKTFAENRGQAYGAAESTSMSDTAVSGDKKRALQKDLDQCTTDTMERR